MKCKKCNKELQEKSKFCIECGSRIENKNNKKILIIIGIILLVIIILGIVVLSNIVSNKEDNDEKYESYEKYEEALEVSAENYIRLKEYKLSEESISNIIISDLKKENLINNDLVNKCDGYVLIESEGYDIEDEEYDYDYDAYINCDNYKTKGYNREYAKKSNIVVKNNKEDNNKEENINNENDNSTSDKNGINDISKEKDVSKEKKCLEYVSKIPNINENIVQKYEFSKAYEYAEPYSNYRNTLYYKSELTLYKYNIAHIVDSDGIAIRSDAYGIYEIKNGILSIKYSFNLDNKEDGTVYDCRDIKEPYSVDEFIINSDGNLSIPTERTSFKNNIENSNIILEKVK